jgi:hypothetical protein
MAISEKGRAHIEHVAERSLSTLKIVADTARASIDAVPSTSRDALASVNTFNSPLAIQALVEAHVANRESNERLCDEPAIARVVVVDRRGTRSDDYICRAMPVTLPDKSIKLASYRSHMGRLAALPVGSDFTARIAGQAVELEILERAELHPTLDGGDWDSLRSVLQGARATGP